MALVKYGAGIIQMSGSIGGQTFSRNASGNYVRSKTMPVNPNSARQATVRTILGNLSHVWSNSLTAAQRSGWNEYAANVQVTNRLGETVYLSGFNHFCRGNAARILAGMSRVNAAPSIFTLPDTDPSLSIAVDSSTQELTVTFDVSMEWVDETGGGILIYQGKPVSSGVNFFAGPWRFVDSVDGDDSSPPTSGSAIDSVFTVASGQLAYCKARIVRADGRISEFFRPDVATVS